MKQYKILVNLLEWNLVPYRTYHIKNNSRSTEFGFLLLKLFIIEY